LASPGQWSSIELRDLRVFLTLADELHFGRTADRLGISHSRVSQTIRLLETRMNTKLFDRSSRRVRLTAIGEQLQDRVMPALEQIQSAYAAVSELANDVSGTVRLGVQAHAYAGLEVIVETVRVFESRYPKCAVQLIDMGTERDPFERLRRGELDLMLARLPITAPDLIIGPTVSAEARVLAVARNHPLAGRAAVSVEDFADYVTTDTDLMPRELIESGSPPLTPTGRTVRRTKVASVAETAVRVATGELIHPTVPSFFKRFSDFGLIAVPISDLPASNCALTWLRGSTGSKVEAFARAASDALKADDVARRVGSHAPSTAP
jgi:DNA-binding transcriptional LysR family regulator